MRLINSLKISGIAVVIAMAGYVTSATAQEPAATAAPADDNYPLVSGDFWEVTGVDIKPGGGLYYANHLADRWRASQEFAKSKGWIKNYMVFGNYHNRPGEPDLYLVTVMEKIPTGPESEAQYEEFRAWAKATTEQLASENADRAEFREITGTTLLQELNFRE